MEIGPGRVWREAREEGRDGLDEWTSGREPSRPREPEPDALCCCAVDGLVGQFVRSLVRCTACCVCCTECDYCAVLCKAGVVLFGLGWFGLVWTLRACPRTAMRCDAMRCDGRPTDKSGIQRSTGDGGRVDRYTTRIQNLEIFGRKLVELRKEGQQTAQTQWKNRVPQRW
ncbi:hypothetical protein F4780DRAFT_721428 [Xylariomycetidae sp. FL0641]|nr:hypothetical protein F4780DRAFT_721428 [Xylariomycetidae sp. FL0641]